VLELTDGFGAHHVIEMSGGENLGLSVAALALGGRISLVGLLGSSEIRAPIGPILFKRAQIVGIGVGHRRAQEDMVAAIDRLSLRPVIDKTYPFAHTPEAIAHLRRGPFGKVVVSI
jgi:NADPH:quinone reductase-like Zn-dependent oxidoreductase